LAGFLRTGARSWYASLDMGTEALELKRLEALAQVFRLLSPLTTREEVYARTVQALKASTRAASALLFFTGRKGTSWNWWPRRGFPPPGWGCA
jgi:hypothetical protein